MSIPTPISTNSQQLYPPNNAFSSQVQDLSETNLALVRLISHQHTLVVGVGDSQQVLGWRGSGVQMQCWRCRVCVSLTGAFRSFAGAYGTCVCAADADAYGHRVSGPGSV